MCAYRIDQEVCSSCLRCLQSCPVSAIRIRGSSVEIDQERCINCGNCKSVCGHGAIGCGNQIDKVKTFIRDRRKVILSLDPACRTFLPQDVTLEQLAAAVQKLGVWDVADASEAVAAVAAEYVRLLQEKEIDNLILTACPVVRGLVELYYPELTALLAPVASPMIAHGRMLKRDFTSAAVVYVTTCGARTEEARDVRHSTEINAVVSVGQLLEWLAQEGVDPRTCQEEPLLSESGGVGAYGAFAGGMLECVDWLCPEHGYTRVVVDGVRRVMDVLEELKSGALHHCILDLSACQGGCIGAQGGGRSLVSAQQEIRGRVEKEGLEPYFDTQGIAMMNPAIARPVSPYTPTEEEVQSMLFQIGVGNPRQQQNCGACGFATCRERAMAILEHRENVSLCRRVVYEARRDMFSVVYDQLPMAALLVDETQKVVGLNSEACSLFSIQPHQEKYIFELMDPGEFQYVLDTGLPIKNRRMDIPEIFMRVEANLVPLKSLNMVLGLFQDITEEEEEEAAQQRSRLQSVEMAQKVIEKQMTVAQQIAFLLGETTAETKVTLNQLKSRILGEEEAP